MRVSFCPPRDAPLRRRSSKGLNTTDVNAFANPRIKLNGNVTVGMNLHNAVGTRECRAKLVSGTNDTAFENLVANFELVRNALGISLQ